jgi:hypothetical protein
LKPIKILHEAIEKAHFRNTVMQSGFWFVDIPRTGSTLIRHNLWEEFGYPHGKTKKDKPRQKRMYLPAHATAQMARQKIGPHLWEKLFTFTFVRNPYERFVSLYLHFRYREIRFDWDFETFAKDLQNFDPHAEVVGKQFYAYRQVDYVMDKHGVPLLSYVGKFETREKDLQKIRASLGMNQWDDARINRSMAQGQEDPRSMYTVETKKIVYDYFQSDFETFDYSPDL